MDSNGDSKLYLDSRHILEIGSVRLANLKAGVKGTGRLKDDFHESDTSCRYKWLIPLQYDTTGFWSPC